MRHWSHRKVCILFFIDFYYIVQLHDFFSFLRLQNEAMIFEVVDLRSHKSGKYLALFFSKSLFFTKILFILIVFNYYVFSFWIVCLFVVIDFVVFFSFWEFDSCSFILLFCLLLCVWWALFGCLFVLPYEFFFFSIKQERIWNQIIVFFFSFFVFVCFFDIGNRLLWVQAAFCVFFFFTIPFLFFFQIPIQR